MNIFSFIKNRVPILDLVSEYTTLKKAGGYWKGCCPFHQEKTASFTVSPHKEIFYCFGCHISGDVISFIAKIEHCSPLEAVKFLAQRYQIDVPQSIDMETSAEETDKKNQYFYVCQRFAQWAHHALLNSPVVLNYLEERGFSLSVIKNFQLGYLPGGLPGVKALTSQLQKHHILAADLIKAGILSEGKTVLYSPFEERILFPITDHLGRFCGFGGRVFKIDDTRPKYYNSRENEYFTKGSLLFGLDHAKKQIQAQGFAFLVEGYTDCLAMVQQGYLNTVATLGTACTLAHLKLIARYAENLYLLYDGDQAGHQAMLRITELCWQVNLELKVISLPVGQDPASFLKAGNNLAPLIENAPDIFLFFVQTAGQQFMQQTLQEKVSRARKVLDIIKGVPDALKQDILLQQAAQVFEIPFSSLKQELLKGSSRSLSSAAPEEESAPLSDQIEAPKLEKKIFCAIISQTVFFDEQTANYLTTYMPEPFREFLIKLQTLKQHRGNISFVDFFDTLESNEKHYISKLLLEHDEEISESGFHHLVSQLRKKQWRVVVHDIKQKLERAKQRGDEQTVQELLKEFITLKRSMVAVSGENNNHTQKGYKTQ